MNPIIDAQSHFMPDEVAQNTAFFKVNWSDLDRQLAVMDQFGIERSVLLYPTSDAHLNMGGWGKLCRSYNDGIMDAVKGHPDRFAGGFILPVDDPDTMPEEFGRCLDGGLTVLSLASSYDGKYLDDPLFEPVFETAAKQRVPVHIHPQIIQPIGEERVRDPLLSPVLEYVFDVSMCLGKMMMAGVFERHPDVHFIFAHYGGVLPFVKERFDNTYQMLRGRNFVKDLGRPPSEIFRNIYLDTSGSRSLASLQCALEVVDAGHILFASDYPANQDLEGSIRIMEESGLPEEDTARILGDNMRALLSAV